MTRASLIVGAAIVPVGWALAAGGIGMTGHMAGHMLAVAVAAPLLALGLSGTLFDPSRRWPRRVTPMAMMLVELVSVWGWHLPALRIAAHASLLVLALEQVWFVGAGFLLWSAVIAAPQRASGVGALLLTSMHMTLLGVLITLAPRLLYPTMPHRHAAGLDAMTDQQLGGVVMLAIGAVSYLAGGLFLLASMLRQHEEPST